MWDIKKTYHGLLCTFDIEGGRGGGPQGAADNGILATEFIVDGILFAWNSKESTPEDTGIRFPLLR